MKREERGITLIALIITIIVMLLLLGVTVAVALNGGLFDTTKEATTETQYEADREILQEGIIGALNKDLKIPNMDILKSNLPENWEVIEEEDGTYTVRSAKGNEYKVDKNGIVDESQESNHEWWEFTEEEYEIMGNSNATVAYSPMKGGGFGYFYWINDEKEKTFYLMGYTGLDGSSGQVTEETKMFIFLVEGEPDDSDLKKLERKKWYCSYLEGDGVMEGWNLYTGECPFKLEDFKEDEIVCRSYLERIIENFNK